jgi:hypothetical protein
MKSGIERRLRSFVAERFLSQEEPWAESAHAPLRSSGVILGDTEVIELIEFLEKAFGIVVLDEEIHPGNLDTIRALAAYVVRKRAQAGRRQRAVSPTPRRPDTKDIAPACLAAELTAGAGLRQEWPRDSTPSSAAPAPAA